MIAMIDYGMGNLRSVQKALERVGAHVRVVRAPGDIDPDARALVVPGQGAFRDCIAALRDSALAPAIHKWLDADRPFLGICLGLQALFELSFENGRHHGLARFAGTVDRLHAQPPLRIPQIGWNQVDIVRAGCPLFEGVPPRSYFYFDHSFCVRPTDPSLVVGQTPYGESFASAIWHSNLFAVQFHPEKSQTAGLQLLKNFVTFSDAHEL